MYGIAHVHAFAIDAEAGTMRLRQRFVFTAIIRAIKTKIGKCAGLVFGSDGPCGSVLGKFFPLRTMVPAVDSSRKARGNCYFTLQHVPGIGRAMSRTGKSENVVVD